MSTNDMGMTLPAVGDQYSIAVVNANNEIVSRLLFDKSSDIVSATTLALPTGSSQGQFSHVTGTNEVQGADASITGRTLILVFDGICQMTHNATSWILPGGANFNTAAGDVFVMRADGTAGASTSNYRMVGFQLASGGPLAGTIGSAEIKIDLITGHSELAEGPAETDELLISDSGTFKKINAVELLNPEKFTALVVSPASGDEIFINDGGTGKKITADDFMFGNATTPTTQAHGDSAATGSAIEAARIDHKHAMPSAGGGFTPTVAFTSEFATPASGGPLSVGSNNNAVYCPINIPGAMTITKIGIVIGTSSGNIDVGIYNNAGTLLRAAGATASPGTGIQWITITSTVLAAGQHWMAVSSDNTTVTFFCGNAGTTLTGDSVVIIGTDYPLPSTFTPPSIPTGTTGRTAYMMGVA